jgi:hypothetical protein
MSVLLWMLFLIGGVITAATAPGVLPEEELLSADTTIVPNTRLSVPQMQWSIKPLNVHFLTEESLVLTEESLVKLWDEYKQDCWNDSTVTGVNATTYWLSPAELREAGINPNLDVCRFIPGDTTWAHWHQADFPGFIEYLRKGKP